MYVWTIEFEDKWDNSGDFFVKGLEWTVAAKDYDEALEKAKGVALGRTWEDDENGEIHKVIDVRLTSIQRGVELDA